MKTKTAVSAAAALLIAAGASIALSLPSSAESSSGESGSSGRSGSSGGELPTVAYLPMELAQEAAEAAIENCDEQGFAVTATVVDAHGVVVVVLRSDGTTAASVDSSKGKAVASAGFRTPTDVLAQNEPQNPGILQMPGFVILGGGLPISSEGAVVGGIGVGGAPSGAIDKTCAQAGLDALADSL